MVAASLLLLAAPAACCRAQDEGGSAAPVHGVMLLRNGQTLQGAISHHGDRYEILVDGGRILVKAADVDLCCGSLDEVYLQKRARLTLPAAREHIELARWCQRLGLFEAAAAELARAEALEPTHPLIPLLRRGLAMALDRPAAAVGDAPVRTASFSSADLDRMVRQMPPGAVESFAQTVQPLLVNRCGASACHGPGSTTEFSLLRAAPSRPPSRRLTQRNLNTVLGWIDRQDPAASRLLTAPIRPHGSLEAPIFDGHNAGQYKQLVDWVYRLSRPGQPPDATVQRAHLETERPSPEADPAVYMEPMPGESAAPDRSEPSWVEQFRGLGVVPEDALGPDGPPGTPGSIDPLPGVQRGARLPSFTPKDPFDPEIFNRRFSDR